MPSEDLQKAARYQKTQTIILGFCTCLMLFALFVGLFFPERTDRLVPIFFLVAVFCLLMTIDARKGRLVFIWKVVKSAEDKATTGRQQP